MAISNIITTSITIAVIVIIYIIIVVALKVMYNDMKPQRENSINDEDNMYKEKVNNMREKMNVDFGIEIINSAYNCNFKRGAIIPIDKNITIGRGKEKYIAVLDPFVSSNHCNIFLENNHCFVQDLDSRNGTKVNGENIKGKVKLYDKDEISIGNLILKVIA